MPTAIWNNGDIDHIRNLLPEYDIADEGDGRISISHEGKGDWLGVPLGWYIIIENGRIWTSEGM